MADKQSAHNQNSSDEIDLGQLFQLIGRGFNAIFRSILRIFLYLKKNILILIGLFILGLAIGYGLNKIISKKLKTEVIVKPQMESKNYLYDVVEEIQSNISARDTLFFESIGMNKIDFSGLEIAISPVDNSKKSTESEMKYLELLQSFENTGAIADIVREELENKSSFNHRITFFYKNIDTGKIFAEKIMDYINSNPYFEGLIEISRANANGRIEANQILLKQVDEIISNYTDNLGTKGNAPVPDRIVLDNQEQGNIADLFEFKSLLIRDTEEKKIELMEQTEPISVINFGKPQVVRKSFFGKNLVLLPLIFIGVFFLISFLIYLNNKAQEISYH